MKYFSLILALSLTMTFPVNADNIREEAFLEKVKSDLLVHDSSQLHSNLSRLNLKLKKLPDDIQANQIEQIQLAYLDVIKSWKPVEAIYLAGNIDSDFLDHPRYIDHFHQGNESIPKQIDRALAKTTDLNKALFKYSSRSINALDYLLFPPSKDGNSITAWQVNSSRRIKMAIFIVEQIQSYTSEIADFYLQDQFFVQAPKQSVAAIFNALVASSFRLKNWRVGEAGGLVAKTQGKPSALHLEYYYSGYSLDAVKAILQTHRRVFEIGDQAGFFQLNSQVDQSDIAFMRKRIDDALHNAESINGSLKNMVESPQYKSLFQALSLLHDAYYFMLIDALGIQGNIVDADGD